MAPRPIEGPLDAFVVSVPSLNGGDPNESLKSASVGGEAGGHLFIEVEGVADFALFLEKPRRPRGRIVE